MAKQCYEKSINTALCGILDKTDDGHYYVTVELKDDMMTVDFDQVLEENLGRLITFKSEETIL